MLVRFFVPLSRRSVDAHAALQPSAPSFKWNRRCRMQHAVHCCAPLPHLLMHCSAFAPRKPCSNHRTSHPHCCARYRCPPSFQIAQREAFSRCISQAAARAGHAAARRHQKGCKRELNPRAAASGGNKKCKAAGRNSAASTRACSSKQNKESVGFMRDGGGKAAAAMRARHDTRTTIYVRRRTACKTAN